jgi:hypothetical protein
VIESVTCCVAQASAASVLNAVLTSPVDGFIKSDRLTMVCGAVTRSDVCIFM